jgi:hypothetical protein
MVKFTGKMAINLYLTKYAMLNFFGNEKEAIISVTLQTFFL